MATKSRADYFRERRKSQKQLNVSINKDTMEKLEAKLDLLNKTKKTWLEEKISEELEK